MKAELLKQEEVPLLSRKRASFMITFEGSTPDRLKLRKEISRQLKSDEKLTFVRHIYQRFGTNNAKVIAHVYNNEADAKLIEDKATIKKHTPEAKKEAKAE